MFFRPLALMTLAILPLMAFGAQSEMEMYFGADEATNEQVKAGSPGAIVAEALSNIRTVASLALEEERAKSYQDALEKENKAPIMSIVKKGSLEVFELFRHMLLIVVFHRWDVGTWPVHVSPRTTSILNLAYKYIATVRCGRQRFFSGGDRG
jgi:ABC transporter transmembrane region